jgi:hypothetical protein
MELFEPVLDTEINKFMKTLAEAAQTNCREDAAEEKAI